MLLEGSPGIVKTSLVEALSARLHEKVTRINLCDRTGIADLFGADLPVEGRDAGHFQWRNGHFLTDAPFMEYQVHQYHKNMQGSLTEAEERRKRLKRRKMIMRKKKRTVRMAVSVEVEEGERVSPKESDGKAVPKLKIMLGRRKVPVILRSRKRKNQKGTLMKNLKICLLMQRTPWGLRMRRL